MNNKLNLDDRVKVDNPGGGYCGDYAFFMAIFPSLKREILSDSLEKGGMFNKLYFGYKKNHGDSSLSNNKKNSQLLSKKAFKKKLLDFNLNSPDKDFLTLISLSLRTILYNIHYNNISSAKNIHDKKNAIFNSSYRGNAGAAQNRFLTQSLYNDWYDYINPRKWFKSIEHKLLKNSFMDKIHNMNESSLKNNSVIIKESLKRARRQLFDDFPFSPGKKFLEEIDLHSMADYFGVNVSVIHNPSKKNIEKSNELIILHSRSVRHPLGHFTAFILKNDLPITSKNGLINNIFKNYDDKKNKKLGWQAIRKLLWLLGKIDSFIRDVLGAGGATTFFIAMMLLIGVSITVFAPWVIPAVIAAMALIKYIYDHTPSLSAWLQKNALGWVKGIGVVIDTFISFVFQGLGAGGATTFFLTVALGAVGVAVPPLGVIIAALTITTIALGFFIKKCMNRYKVYRDSQRNGKGLFSNEKAVDNIMGAHSYGMGIVLLVFGAGGALSWGLKAGFMTAFISTLPFGALPILLGVLMLAGIGYILKEAYTRYKLYEALNPNNNLQDMQEDHTCTNTTENLFQEKLCLTPSLDSEDSEDDSHLSMKKDLPNISPPVSSQQPLNSTTALASTSHLDTKSDEYRESNGHNLKP